VRENLVLRSTHVLILAALVVGLVVPAAAGRDGQTASGTPKPQQQTPVFRAGTHFVQVDAYPRRDGKIVEGLTAKDFQIFEDGKLQAIEALEFIRVDVNTPESERRDPNSQAEGNQLAADSRNRVFILFFDHFHSSLSGGASLRRPIVDMLNRMLSATDLYAPATVHTRGMDLIFARKSFSLEQQLEQNWMWGLKTTKAIDLDPEEHFMQTCYGDEVAGWYARRTREFRVLDRLRELVQYLGALREARKVFVVFTRGWPLAREDMSVPNRLIDPRQGTTTGPRIGVGPGGRLGTSPPAGSQVMDLARCNSELIRAATFDNQRLFWDLLDDANANNVTFYPVHPDGLTMGSGDVLRTLANNTDGFASFTNDHSDLLRRITEDVAAYYVLGYYPTNTNFDGRLRKIQVKVTGQSNVIVSARRGYLAPKAASEGGGIAVAPSKAPSPEGFDAALGDLTRLRPSAELFTFAAERGTDLMVIAELAGSLVSGHWSRGAELMVSVTDAAGARLEAKGRIEPGQRSTLVRIAKPSGPAPYRVTVRATGGGDELRDQLELMSRRGELVGQPLVFRAAPSMQSPLRPMADLQLRRTERARVEWPVLATIDLREARLLAKDGRALAVPVALTELEREGSRIIAADLNLAPLAVGDYVIELTIGAAGKAEQRFVAIRVRQ
jgi:VWFA-related protein